MDGITWQYALGILVVVNIAALVLMKLVSDKFPKKKAKGVFYQYLFCALIALSYFFFWEKGVLNPEIALIGIIGFVNAFGCYFQWQAFELSLSKSVLFLPIMEVVAISLAVIFLGELSLWNTWLFLGVGLCFLSMIIFGLRETDVKGENPNKRWLFSIILAVLIFGIAAFLMKYFSLTVSRGNFLAGWYCGAFMGTLPLLVLERQNPINITKRTILYIVPLSFAILGALFALYWTYQLGGPISLVNPLKGVFITVVPALLGWIMWREAKKLSRKERYGSVIGLIGAIIVLLS